MFPYKSSSNEISSKANAFVQNCKDNDVGESAVPTQLAELTVGTCCSNESAALARPVQLSSNQVPDMRDTIECTKNTRGEAVEVQPPCVSSVTSTSLQVITSTAAQSTKPDSTVEICRNPKEAMPSVAPPFSASQVDTGSMSIVEPLHTGCDPCGCCNHHVDDKCGSCSKSEALCQAVCQAPTGTSQLSVEGVKGLSPMSVISSSSGQVAAAEVELYPPSPSTKIGAQQGSIASDHGSSSLLRQENCAQSDAAEPRSACFLVGQPGHHQKANALQCYTADSVDTQRQNSRGVSTGALSDQDNNCNVKAKDSNNSVKEHSQMGGGDEARRCSGDNAVWSRSPFLNIPEAGGSLVSQAIHATVQGINDSSNPPASFNTSGNVSSYKLDADLASVESLDEDAAGRAPAAVDEIYASDKSDASIAHPIPTVYTNAQLKANDNVLPSTDEFQCASRRSATDVKASQAPKYKLNEWTYLDGPASNRAWGIPRWAGLRGGGEMSLNNGTTNWGASPSGNSNANNSNNNSGNNQGGQAQWGGPGPNNNNRSNAGASQGTSTQPNAANKGANPQSASGVGAGSQPGAPPQGQQAQQGPTANQPGQAQPNQPHQAHQPPPSTSQPPPPSQNGSNSWAQAAGGNQAATTNPTPGGPNNATPAMPPSSAAATTPSTKQQLEQLNTMREALFSQDGWGGQNVNQDTGWDIPSSPEPATKDNNGGSPGWKPNVNNGTDLWELTLRHNGQPPPQTQPKVPWVHTPSTNIGGTWGEDDADDMGDSSNMWTGVPTHPISPAVPQGGPGWGGGNGGPAGPGPGPAGGMWGPKKDDWSRGGSNWGEPRNDPRGGDPRMETMGGVDPREMRAVSSMDPRDMRGDPRDMRPGGGMVEVRPGPIDPMRNDPNMRDPRDMRVMGDNRGGDSMMRGDHRGISGRLNGAVDDPSMWPRPMHHNMLTQSQPPQKMVGPGGVGSGGGHFPGSVNQWAAPPPKDMGISGGGSSKASGWEEPSPPAQRRNIPNYDDGTSLWSQQQNRMGGGKVSHWKEMPSGNMSRGMQCPPGMPQNHMPGNNASNMKPDGQMWPHASRNGSWEPQPDNNAPWAEDGKGNLGGMNNWNEPPLSAPSWGNMKQQKNPMQAPWPEGDAMDASSSWAHPPKPGPKQLTKEMVWNSKQFRMLTEMGFKKEDVENALRVSNMSMEDSLELLNTNRLHVEAWRSSGRDEHTPFDLGPNHPGGNSGPGGFSTRVLASSAPPMPFAPPKILNQQPPPQQPPSSQQAAAAAAVFNQRNPQSQRSNQQIRMLVQQIQMAVHAGYLNNQFLNQPLAPATLVLLNQLLQQIKILQQLSQQHTMAAVQKAGSNAVLQMSVQITKTKQYIANLQNQIVAQQAIYVKQHQHQVPPQNPDFFKQNMHDPISALPTNFADLSMKEPQVVSEQSFQGQQSRLNQWKLPSLDKETDVLGNEFSRAPGTTSKTPGLVQSHSSPNINPLLSQGDGPWASVARSNSDTGWPDAPNADVPGQPDKDWPITSQSNSAAFTDLVPEFEPGKPWKGNQMKSIEDDPSITPGSVVRSPLSLNATLKDTEIFSSSGMGKTSPTSSNVDMPPPLSLSSSTWSYPASSTASAFTSPLGPGGQGGAGGGGQASGAGAASNGWGNVVARSVTTPTTSSWGMQGGGGAGSGSAGAWGSTWLLLKNLTPQIDGSTLKTLCVQHGPLQSFHLYLNHGIALAKYNTREEANKAQGALNNCVLGNTTIFAESPGETEAHTLLSHLAPTSGQQQGGSAPNWNMRSGGAGSGAPPSAVKVSSQASQDAWSSGGGGGGGGAGGGNGGGGSQLWTANPATSSLWSAPPMDAAGDQHRATPSSLNSFLPGDLLGGESM